MNVSLYGAGLYLAPARETAHLVEKGGQLVATGSTPIDDDIVRSALDAERR